MSAQRSKCKFATHHYREGACEALEHDLHQLRDRPRLCFSEPGPKSGAGIVTLTCGSTFLLCAEHFDQEERRVLP